MDTAALIRDRFTEEEWAKLSTAPLLMATLIMQAGGTGGLGAVKELLDFVRYLDEAATVATSGFLCDAILADQRSALRDMRSGARKVVLAHEGDRFAEVNDVLDILAAKCDLNESLQVRTMLFHIANRVAESAREGGFLGFGGVKVSDAEKAVLTRLRVMMNL